MLCKIRTQRKDTLDIVIRSDAMNDAENDSRKQHVLHQFVREENGLEFLFLLDGMPVDATRWRADMIFVTTALALLQSCKVSECKLVTIEYTSEPISTRKYSSCGLFANTSCQR